MWTHASSHLPTRNRLSLMQKRILNDGNLAVTPSKTTNSSNINNKITNILNNNIGTSTMIKLTVKDDVKQRLSTRRSSRFDHHNHHIVAPRSRSKVTAYCRASRSESSNIGGGISPSSPKNLIPTMCNSEHDAKTTTNNTNTMTRRIRSTTVEDHEDSLNGNNSIISLDLKTAHNEYLKRGKRSLSSTRIEKERSDEKNSKLLRKTGAQSTPLFMSQSTSSNQLSTRKTMSPVTTSSKSELPMSLRLRKR